jgi:DNA-binding transcriptional LysR family regulator
MPKPRPKSAKAEGPNIDWVWLRSFVAVVDTGSLTAAARRLNTTQPTVGRHIRAMERQLGETLFDRQPGGLVPSPRGTEIYERAAAVEQAVTGLSASIAQINPQLSGLVRLTTSVVFATELLPGLLAELLREHPLLQIEIIASDDVRNLLRREADVAVRFVRPDQADVIATKVGELAFGLFAHRDYLARIGAPRSLKALEGHTFIGYEDPKTTVDFMTRFAARFETGQVRVRSDSFLVHLEALRSACGIGACQTWLAARHPELVRLFPKVEVARVPIWVAAHDDLHRSRSLRVVFDHLVRQLRDLFNEA